MQTAFLSNIWKTSKEKQTFSAAKNILSQLFNQKQTLTITIRVKSLKVLYHFMKKIDHEQALEDLIHIYDLGRSVKSITLENVGKLIIEKIDQTIEIYDFTSMKIPVQNQTALTEKEQTALIIAKHLLSSKGIQDHSLSIKIEIFQDFPQFQDPSKLQQLSQSESFYQRISSSWIVKYARKILLSLRQFIQQVDRRSNEKKTFDNSLQKTSDPLGMAILKENFHIFQGAKAKAIQRGWFHDQLILRTLLRAIKFAEEDRQEMIERKEAADQHRYRKNRKTLLEKREEFEKIYSISHPENVFKHMTITTIDDVKLDTFAIGNSQSATLPASQQKWIVFFHPADAAYENELSVLSQIVEDSGANLYTGNYRGVGKSSGKPSCSYDLVLDGETMVQHLLAAGVLPQHILIHGFSLGGGIATEIVAMHPGMHLCNDRSFTKLTDAFYELIPSGFKGFLVKHLTYMRWEFDSLHHLENIMGHVVVIASLIDKTIRGKAKLARWVSLCTGLFERKVIWLTETYSEEPNETIRAIRAHSDPITMTSKYEEYLAFVQEALKLETPNSLNRKVG